MMAYALSPIDERAGLIRWVLDIPIEPGEPEVFNASVKMADISVYNPRPCYDNNGGSGLTREQARAAAVGEGLERYCCAVFYASDLICGTAAELRDSHPVRPPGDFALFHPEQPGRWASPSETTPVAWAWGWSLTHGRATLIPACLVYMPYFPCFRGRGEQVAGPAVSTGLACADSLQQAALRGAYELLERDAFVITWYNRLPVPQVDVESHPDLRRLYRGRLARRGLRYVLFQTTTDIPVASFLCLLIDEMQTPPMITAGGAASLDPVTAAQKAMLEAVQTREWAKFLGGVGRKFTFAPDFSDIRDFEDHVALYAYGDMLHAVEFLLEGSSDLLTDCWESRSTGDDAADLDQVVSIIGDAGFETIVLDLTTRDVCQCGLRVTRTLVPELQPLDADYLHRFLGGTRLYEAPVRMGYAAHPRLIETLNPYPHPYP
jgi:ribosomal protein S12 methylthiotransferase accessory factor